jgi:hypothetical protein
MNVAVVFTSGLSLWNELRLQPESMKPCQIETLTLWRVQLALLHGQVTIYVNAVTPDESEFL